MRDLQTCDQCKAPLTEEAVSGMCPACLMRGALGPSETRMEEVPDLPFSLEELGPFFPDYELERGVARGGMGAVYRARHRKLDRPVAKILLPELMEKEELAQRFLREARAMARLNHQNIVSVYDFGQCGPYYFLALEYVEGTNLREVMGQEKLSPEQALSIVPRICDALQYAHGQGVVHRDVKPENIMLTVDGQVKVTDFGLAKLTLEQRDSFGRLTLTGQFMGTLGYMAPEQIERPEDVDHRADIYSLGVVLYEMLTGEVPKGHFELPSERLQVDVRVDEVVVKSLASQREKRYQQVTEIKTDLEKLGKAPSVGRSPRGSFCERLRVRGRSLKRLERRHVMPLAFGGVFMLLILGSVGLLASFWFTNWMWVYSWKPLRLIPKPFESPIHRAARRGDIAEVNQASKSRNYVLLLDSKGRSVFHVAARYGHASTVRALQRSYWGESLEQDVDYVGNTPAHLAARHGHVEVLRALEDLTIKVNDEGRNLLHEACLGGREGAASFLLDKVDKRFLLEEDFSGATPIEYAVKAGLSGFLRQLTAESFVDSRKLSRWLEIALRSRRLEPAMILLEHLERAQSTSTNEPATLPPQVLLPLLRLGKYGRSFEHLRMLADGSGALSNQAILRALWPLLGISRDPAVQVGLALLRLRGNPESVTFDVDGWTVTIDQPHRVAAFYEMLELGRLGREGEARKVLQALPGFWSSLEVASHKAEVERQKDPIRPDSILFTRTRVAGEQTVRQRFVVMREDAIHVTPESYRFTLVEDTFQSPEATPEITQWTFVPYPR